MATEGERVLAFQPKTQRAPVLLELRPVRTTLGARQQQARGAEVAFSVALVLAAVGCQGRPRSAGRRFELGRGEDGVHTAGLSPGAQPAPPAGAEPAFPPEPVGQEEFAARSAAGA